MAWTLVRRSKLEAAPWPEPFEARHRSTTLPHGASTRKDLGYARAFALDRAHTFDLAFACDETLARARDHAVALARDLARIPTFDFYRFLAHGRTLDRELADLLLFAFDGDNIRPFNLAFDLDFALDLVCKLAHAFPDRAHARALVPDLDLYLGCVHDLALALEPGLSRARALGSDSGQWLLIVVLLATPNARDPLTALADAYSLGLALLFLCSLDNRLGFGGRNKLVSLLRRRLRSGRLVPVIDPLRGAIWNLHMAARLAHARMEGTDPPFEALRIVSETIEM